MTATTGDPSEDVQTAPTPTPEDLRRAILEQLGQGVNARAVRIAAGDAVTGSLLADGLTVVGARDLESLASALESVDRVYRAEQAAKPAGAQGAIDLSRIWHASQDAGCTTEQGDRLVAILGGPAQ